MSAQVHNGVIRNDAVEDVKSPSPVRAGARPASPPGVARRDALDGDFASPARGRGRPRVVSGPGEGESDIPTAWFRLRLTGRGVPERL